MDSGDPAKGGDKDNLIFCPTKPAILVCVLPPQRFKSFQPQAINQNKEKGVFVFSFLLPFAKRTFLCILVCAASEKDQ